MSEVAASTEVEKPNPEVVEGASQEVKTEEQKTEDKKDRVYTQDEIDKILAKVRKNERYRTKKEVEAYYKGLTEAQQREQPKPKVEEDKEPVRGDFESYEAFIEARADYRARKAVGEERVKAEKAEKEKEATENRQKKAGDFQKKVRDKFPDIDERIEEVGDMPMYVGVQDAISESNLGPEIFNELLTNPKEFERLANMSESAAIREIGKLEARLEGKASTKAEEKKEPKQASKAPPPATPPSGASGSSDDMPKDTDSTEDWMRKERARLAKQRK